jgi:polyisoprenoid-binding protein YceI
MRLSAEGTSRIQVYRKGEQTLMTRTRRIALGLVFGTLAAAGSAFAATETFQFDKAHSLVGFKIRHFVSKVEGRFKDFDGVIQIDRQNPSASKVELTIQTASIDTANENRDKDLKSPNFFEVEKYSTITFKSTKVEPKGGDTYEVAGDLTMHGVVKPVKLTVKSGGFIKAGKVEKAGFEVSGTLNRKDFGIIWNRALDQGATMLGDDVDINIQVEANKPEAEAQKAAPPAKG